MKTGKRWRRAFWTVGSLLAVLTVGVAGLVLAEWNYVERLMSFPTDQPAMAVDWYQPKVRIAGTGVRPLPMTAPDEIELTADVLDRAAQHAEDKNSAALLVLHRGHIVLERYWQEHSRHQWSLSASMAKTVTALLIGIAIDEGHIPSVDEPAATYIPAWRSDSRRRSHFVICCRCDRGFAPWASTTIHHLMPAI